MTNTKCGFIAIVGRPNVGKSTLLNAILNKKVSITSPKPQTTRDQILGIKTEGDTQAIYIDTPGIHSGVSKALNKHLNKLARSSTRDANVIIFMVDNKKFNSDDEAIIKRLPTDIPVLLVINKIDALPSKADVLPLIDALKDKFPFTDIIPLSAKNKDNVLELENILQKFLPEAPHFYADDAVTDKPKEFQITEIIREKIILNTSQEVPYSTKVEVESFKQDARLIEIHALIWVEKEGQKAIIIGEKGARLKKIGTSARKELEVFFDQKVMLRLWVKIKENWTEDATFFGKDLQ